MLAVAAILVATSAGTPAGAKPSALAPADALLAFADDLLTRDEPYRAIGEYDRFLFVCGDCERAPYASLRRAEALRLAGDARGAEEAYRRVSERWPAKTEGRDAGVQVGFMLESAGDPGAASDAYRMFATAHPSDAVAPEEATLALRTALRAHDRSRVALAIPLAAPGATGSPRELRGLITEMNATRAPHRSPALAGALSAAVPGAGHVYAGQYRTGAVAFVTNALFVGATVIAAQKKEWAVAGTLGGLEVFWYGGSVVGAMNAADRFNDRSEDARWRGLEQRWLGTPMIPVSFQF
jgi:hypothetical protein